MPNPSLTEFFVHALREGPTDPTFSPPPEADVAAGGDEGGLEVVEPTQDVAHASASSLDFFSKNVGSVLSKSAVDGFDGSGLEAFARSLDASAFSVYSAVQDPNERQAFEADYQKIAADASKDWAKLLEKLRGLRGHAAP